MTEEIIDIKARTDIDNMKGDISETKCDVRLIRDNHLPHLKERMDEGFSRLSYWLIGLMGGMIVSLILLIVNLITKK